MRQRDRAELTVVSARRVRRPGGEVSWVVDWAGELAGGADVQFRIYTILQFTRK